MRKLISLGVIYSMCILTLGCSNTEEIDTKENIKEINSIEKTAENEESKITMTDSISEVKEKIYNACVLGKEDKTMDKSVEYVKSILPDGSKEIEREYDEITTEDTDSNLTEGVTFPLVEVNANWNSSSQ